MADKKISQLTGGTITNDNDVFVMDTYEGVTVKIPYSVLKRTVTDGITPSIDETTKHWLIGSTDTNVVAEGQNGANGITPHIDNTSKHWIIGENDTGVVAEGQNGAQGEQGIPGNDGASISFTTAQITGGHSVTISSTDISVSDRTFNVMDGADGEDGDSISATVSTITGGHRITIHHTDGITSDETFDVMDGTEIIQASSDNRQITLFAADWVGSSAPYTQTVTVLGMTSSVVPIIGLVPSTTVETGIEEQKQWSYITKAVSGADSITFSCYKTKPTIDLTANVKAV